MGYNEQGLFVADGLSFTCKCGKEYDTCRGDCDMDKVALIPAVERLLIDIDKEEVLDASIQRVKDALGYDPTLTEQDYLVTLEIDVWAKDPKDAVKQFIKIVEEEDSMTSWMYRVVDENQVATVVPGWGE